MGKTQLVSLTEIELDNIIESAVEKGIKKFNESKEVKREEKRKLNLRNTKKLLENYRNFKKHTVDVIDEQIEKISYQAFLYEHDTNELIVPSILQSKKRTRAIVNFIDRMLNEYRISCENSGSIEMIRRYNAIKMMYIMEPALSKVQIAMDLNISESTLYEDLKKAREELSILIFGIDVIRLDKVI